MTTLISDKTLRELVREAFETPPPIDMALIGQDDDLPIVINPSVDSSLNAIEISPVDVQFVPRDKTEFELAIKSMAKSIPDDVIPQLYAKVREIILDVDDKCNSSETANDKDTEEMSKREDMKLGVEEAIRTVIRQLVNEEKEEDGYEDPHKRWKPLQKKARQDPHMRIGGHSDPDVDDVFDPEAWEPEAPFEPSDDYDPSQFDDDFPGDKPRKKAAVPADLELAAAELDSDPHVTDSAWDPEPIAAATEKKSNRKEYETGVGVEGDVLNRIATELGISTAGARRLVTTGAGKMKYMMDLGDDAVDIVMDATKDYVKYLGRSGELSDEERALLMKHPDIVAGLDGFRDFLHNVIRKEMQRDKEWVYQKDDDEEDK